MAENWRVDEDDKRADIKAEKALFWMPEKLPSKKTFAYGAQRNFGDIVSPTFPCGENECCFGLQHSPVDEKSYLLSIMDRSGKVLSRPFDMTVYIDDMNEPPTVFDKITVRNMPVCLLEFRRDESPRRDRPLKFIFIFHGDDSTADFAERDPCLVSLSNDFYNLLMENTNYDVKLICYYNEIVGAHKIILVLRSEVLKEMLKNTNEIQVDMDKATVQSFLCYLYSAKLPELTTENARLLKNAAKKFNVHSLLRLCADFLLASLSEENAFEILLDAHLDEDFYLKEKVIIFILGKKMPGNDKWSSFMLNHQKLALEVLNFAWRQSL